jgi:hypothetical protein
MAKDRQKKWAQEQAMVAACGSYAPWKTKGVIA